MAKIVWTGPAAREFDELIEYIAQDAPEAATRIAVRIEHHVAQLIEHPKSGSSVPEMPRSSIRQLVEPPCRLFYRVDGETVNILHVLRFERLFRPGRIESENE